MFTFFNAWCRKQIYNRPLPFFTSGPVPLFFSRPVDTDLGSCLSSRSNWKLGLHRVYNAMVARVSARHTGKCTSNWWSQSKSKLPIEIQVGDDLTSTTPRLRWCLDTRTESLLKTWESNKSSQEFLFVLWRWILHCNHNRKVWSSGEKVNTTALSIDPQIRVTTTSHQCLAGMTGLCELLSMVMFVIIHWHDFNWRIWSSLIVLTPTILHPSPCYSSDSLS